MTSCWDSAELNGCPVSTWKWPKITRSTPKLKDLLSGQEIDSLRTTGVGCISCPWKWPTPNLRNLPLSCTIRSYCPNSQKETQLISNQYLYIRRTSRRELRSLWSVRWCLPMKSTEYKLLRRFTPQIPAKERDPRGSKITNWTSDQELCTDLLFE